MGIFENFGIEKAWKQGPEIADGADFEQALLGSAIDIPEGEHDHYLSFKDAIEYTKEHQPSIFDRSEWIKDLRARISEKCTDKDTPVKFYTAVGTPLDIYHGVDAFFEQGGRIATVDVSLHEKEQKADVLLIGGFDEDGNITISEADMETVANQLAEKLNAAH